jgi:MoaA/NifB/PqqE/SkfB family radical SAM enzyme
MRYSRLSKSALPEPIRQQAGPPGWQAGSPRRAPGPSMDAARWSNVAALDGDYAAGRARLNATPLEAYVEVSARCNLRCRMCPITVDPRYDPHSGTPPLLVGDIFDRLEPLIPTLQRVYLQGLGEPFLNRDLISYAERLAGAGVEVWITTNATLVRDEHAEALALAGVARMTVSIDGPTAATYERIRIRGKFDQMLRGLRALGGARRRHGRPQLFLSMIAMASNIAELPLMVELCAEVGGDGVFLEGLYDWPGLEEFSRLENLSQVSPERVQESLAEAHRRAAALGVQLYSRLGELALFADRVEAAAPAPQAAPAASAEASAPGIPPAADVEAGALVLPWACSEPWATVNINAAGDVRTCCFNDQSFGNLGEQSFEAIWNSAGYQQMRADHVAGRVPASCSTCVRNGRVKRSAFLGPREAVESPGQVEPQPDPEPAGQVEPRPAAPRRSPGLAFLSLLRPQRRRPAVGRPRLLAPADGELIAGPLVVLGEMASPWPRLPWKIHPSELPELWMDGSLLVRLRDYALIEGSRFAAVVAIPFVTQGAHRISLAQPADAATWEHRRLQVGRIGGDATDPTPDPSGELPPAPATLVAVATLAFALPLSCREPTPSLRLAGRRHPLAAWFCSWSGNGWTGVAAADLRTLAPGAYPLELRLSQTPPFRRLLERLSSPVNPGPHSNSQSRG